MKYNLYEINPAQNLGTKKEHGGKQPLVSRKDQILLKYFDRSGKGDIKTSDFVIRLLGFISFTVAILAILVFIYFRLFI